MFSIAVGYVPTIYVPYLYVLCLGDVAVLRISALGAFSYSPNPREACTTSSAASGSSWPCLFRLALSYNQQTSPMESGCNSQFLPEKCVGQDNVFDISATWVVEYVFIDEKQ